MYISLIASDLNIIQIGFSFFNQSKKSLFRLFSSFAFNIISDLLEVKSTALTIFLFDPSGPTCLFLFYFWIETVLN